MPVTLMRLENAFRPVGDEPGPRWARSTGRRPRRMVHYVGELPGRAGGARTQHADQVADMVAASSWQGRREQHQAVSAAAANSTAVARADAAG